MGRGWGGSRSVSPCSRRGCETRGGGSANQSRLRGGDGALRLTGGGGGRKKQGNLRQERPFSPCLQPHPISLPHSLLPLPHLYPPTSYPPFPWPAPSSSALPTPLPPPPYSDLSCISSPLCTADRLRPLPLRPARGEQGPASTQERQVLRSQCRCPGQRGNCRESPAQPHARGLLGALRCQTLTSVY